MKRGLLGVPLVIFLIQIISAQFFGGYGSLSISDIFRGIDSETITLGLLFIIFFALLFYATSRIFKNSYGEPNKGIAGTISFAISFLIIYGIYRSGFSIENLFYGFGISIDSGIFYWIASIVLFIGAIFLIKKIKFPRFLIVLGLLLIASVIFTDIFYEETFILVVGLISLILGIILLWRKRGTGGGSSEGGTTTSGGFRYRPLMRRGGLKNTRSRFVSKRAAERYARRFGTGAARRRFG